MKAAVFLGRAQAMGVTSVMLRSRSRNYQNHHVTLEKHPHTGRVLRTVRLALAVEPVGPETRSRVIGHVRGWPNAPTHAWRADRLGEDCFHGKRADQWGHADLPVNLLGCEE